MVPVYAVKERGELLFGVFYEGPEFLIVVSKFPQRDSRFDDALTIVLYSTITIRVRHFKDIVDEVVGILKCFRRY